MANSGKCKTVYKNSKLISHRIRGFDSTDATKTGLLNAIEKGVDHFEIDLRITKDNKLVLNHDPHLLEQYNTSVTIANVALTELKTLTNKNNNGSSLLEFTEFLDITNSYNHKNITIAIDIKETGLEEVIVHEIEKRGMTSQIIVFSWLPEVLFKISKIQKNLKLCFSHIPMKNFLLYKLTKVLLKTLQITKLAALFGKIIHSTPLIHLGNTHFHFGKYNEANLTKRISKGSDHFHFVNGYLKNELLALLQKNKGAICIPYKMANAKLAKHYSQLGINICLFSVNKKSKVTYIAETLKPEYIITDNPEIFLSE